MSYLLIFQSEEFGSLRVLNDSGRYFYCGKDAASAIGYKDTKKAVKDHCMPDEWWYFRVKDSRGHYQPTRFLSKENLLRLVQHSRFPAARAYERWLAEEVLIGISDRQLAGQSQNPPTYSELLGNISAELQASQQRNRELEQEASNFEKLLEVGNDLCIRITAKEIGVPEKQFIRFLRIHHYLYRAPRGELLPYACSRNRMLFQVREFCNGRHTGAYTLITPEGRSYFARIRHKILREE